MTLTELQTFLKTSNDLYVFEVEAKKFLVKCYRGEDAQRHRDAEAVTMAYWKSKGFLVPDVVDISVPGIEGAYLVMSLIEGISFREYLSQSEINVSEKLERVSALFRQVYSRHRLAFETDDRQLIHYDPSTGNILMAQKNFYTIDFESPARSLPVKQSGAIELATLCRWMARDMGAETVPEIMMRLVEAFDDCPMVLQLIVERTAGRSFQFIHRWRNEKRKRVHPQDVTKYDIADTLAKLL
jgi:tRNA A-37 threonylcarbamoyl transferase component Bud32